MFGEMQLFLQIENKTWVSKLVLHVAVGRFCHANDLLHCFQTRMKVQFGRCLLFWPLLMEFHST